MIIKNKTKSKWLIVSFVTVGFIGIVAVSVSHTQVDARPSKIDFVPLRLQKDVSSPSVYLDSHTPSLEEAVRDEFKGMESAKIVDNQVRRRTLTNLQGVYVDVGWGNNDQNLLNEDRVRTDVELKLRYAGINVLSEEQYFRAKGKPLLYVKAFVLPSQSKDLFCGAAFSLELNEQVFLERDPSVTLYLGTWEYCETDSKIISGLDAKAVERGVRRAVKSLVEHFIDDYSHMNSALPNDPTGPDIPLIFAADGDKYSDVALKGLTKVHVPQLYGSDISIKNVIIPQLENVGITVLSSEKLKVGQDRHYHKMPYLSLKAIVTDNDAQCFKFVLPLRLIDRVILVRNPKIIRELPVWESKLNFDMGSPGHKSKVMQDIREDVQDMMDEFINACFSVNSKDI